MNVSTFKNKLLIIYTIINNIFNKLYFIFIFILYYTIVLNVSTFKNKLLIIYTIINNIFNKFLIVKLKLILYIFIKYYIFYFYILYIYIIDTNITKILLIGDTRCQQDPVIIRLNKVDSRRCIHIYVNNATPTTPSPPRNIIYITSEGRQLPSASSEYISPHDIRPISRFNVFTRSKRSGRSCVITNNEYRDAIVNKPTPTTRRISN